MGGIGRSIDQAICGLAAALAVLLIAAPAAIAAIAATSDEMTRANQLKSAYLFNFVKFVEWPAPATPETSGTLTVCFAGGDGVREALSLGIENKRVGTRRLAVRQLQPTDTLSGCDMLYVDTAAPPGGSWSTAREPAVLTVSDASGFARNGGMIELFTESNRLRFRINVDNAQAAGLRISANLLQLAAAIEKGDRK